MLESCNIFSSKGSEATIWLLAKNFFDVMVSLDSSDKMKHLHDS